MIIEASSIPSGEVIDADLCVVGAGPAGLTLARRFVGTDHRVFVLESGTERIDSRAKDLSDGDVIGHPYFDLADATGSAVGGSSHLWDEWMRARPLDAFDFDTRAWVGDSGWPFGRDSLEGYYQKASEMLGLGPYDFDAPIVHPNAGEAGLGESVFKYSNTFDFATMTRAIDASANVGLIMGGHTVELELARDGLNVERLVASFENPQRFSVHSRVYVLAAGGLGNPRLLLLSRGRSPFGVANSSRLVGSYFMEHPTVRRGVVVPKGDGENEPWGFYRFSSSPREARRGVLAPTVAAMERSSILNGMVMLTESDDYRSSEALRSVAIIRDSFLGVNETGESGLAHAMSIVGNPVRTLAFLKARNQKSARQRRFQVSMTIEQSPSRLSKVGLSDRLDRFGLPRVALDWRLGEMEQRTFRDLLGRLDRLLRQADIGHVEGRFGKERPKRVVRGEWHQMGTTRMSSSPRLGVVDPDGKTHDVNNLYVAGASVFPTVGYVNPTLTIVALGLRLADHLEKRLSRSASMGPIW